MKCSAGELARLEQRPGNRNGEIPYSRQKKIPPKKLSRSRQIYPAIFSRLLILFPPFYYRQGNIPAFLKSMRSDDWIISGSIFKSNKYHAAYINYDVAQCFPKETFMFVHVLQLQRCLSIQNKLGRKEGK